MADVLQFPVKKNRRSLGNNSPAQSRADQKLWEGRRDAALWLLDQVRDAALRGLLSAADIHAVTAGIAAAIPARLDASPELTPMGYRFDVRASGLLGTESVNQGDVIFFDPENETQPYSLHRTVHVSAHDVARTVVGLTLA